jgi:hypothetical protein
MTTRNPIVKEKLYCLVTLDRLTIWVARVLQLLESATCLLLSEAITHSTPGSDATYQGTLLYQGATLGRLVLLP